MPISREQLAAIKGDHRIFIETGTSTGNGVDAALAAGFDPVVSIELSDLYYWRCCDRFHGDSRVQLHQGDSGDVLGVLVPLLDKPAVFFLDAHHSAPDSAQGRDINPLMRELAAIGKSSVKNHTVVVDDFLSTGFSTDEIRAAILAINSAYEFTLLDVSQGDGTVTIGGVCVARVKP